MSKKRDKKISLSEKLTSLIQTKPSVIESDDDDIATADKIAPNENDSDYSADELDVSRFRRINNGLLEEDDQKYSGKGISRRDLDDFDLRSDFVESEGDSYSESHDSNTEKGESDEGVEENDEEDESEAEIQPFKSKKNVTKKSKKGRNDGDVFNRGIFLRAASDIEKGRAIKNQLHLWDFLLECRMKFQKCLVASNQLPTFSNFPKFKNIGNPLFQDSVVECQKSLKHLLNSLLILQNVLLNSNEDFTNSDNQTKKHEKGFDDEEIFSGSDTDSNEKNINISSKKLKKLNDFSTEISKRHTDFQNYQNNTIQKWNDKTRIGFINNKNFSAFEQSTLKQIEHVLSDKQRLIRRTQTKRSNYHILGEEEEEEPPTKKLNSLSGENLLVNSLDNKNRSLYKEIFDDDDFYHQLLSEMVRRKANDLTDPVQLGRQWMQLQKIRNKMKKVVDTKASKGRKIRFVVHPKLVNFMMPIYNSNYSEDTKTELFNSLFGKTKN